MRKVFLFSFIQLLAVGAYAQPRIEKSAAIDISYTRGWTKVLQLKNGNTLCVHYGGKAGIETIIFDKDRKEIANTSLDAENWSPKKIKRVTVAGLYEINGEPVIFLVQAQSRFSPSLFRIRINPTTGELVKEEEIFKFPKAHLMDVIGTEGNGYFVEKDPASDNYAVLFFNSVSAKPDERIKVVHYDGNHKVINAAFYHSPVRTFKHLHLIGGAVDGSKRVFVSVYGSESNKGKDGHVYIAKLNAGDSTFVNKTLDFTEDFKDTHSVLAYNHVNNTLQMLSNTEASRKGGFKGTKTTYVSFISYIDPETLGMKGVNPVTGEKLNKYVSDVLGKEKSYTGMPQKMVIDPDNSTTLLQEEMSTSEIRTSKGHLIGYYTTLGNIGVTALSPEGVETDGYAIVKRQSERALMSPLYMQKQDKGIWDNDMFARGHIENNLYMSYDYISTAKGRYILFNDYPKNFEKGEDQSKRKKSTSDLKKLNTVAYTMKDGKIERSYLFGEPDGRRESSAVFINASQFQSNTNTYATIMTEHDGRDWEAKLVWVHFD